MNAPGTYDDPGEVGHRLWNDWDDGYQHDPYGTGFNTVATIATLGHGAFGEVGGLADGGRLPEVGELRPGVGEVTAKENLRPPGTVPVSKTADPSAIVQQNLVRKFGRQGESFLSLLPDASRASIVDKIVKGEAFDDEEQLAVDNAYTTMFPKIRCNSTGTYIRLDKVLDDARIAYTTAISDNPHPWGFTGTNGGKPFARQALGDFGEEFAVEHLTKQGYTEFGTIKNASGHGIDLIAKDPDGKWTFLEVKTSPREISGGLSKDQHDIKSFVEDRLKQAQVREGKWSNATDQTSDYATMLRKEIGKQKDIQGYKVNVHAVKGKPGQFEADVVQWHK